MPATEIREFIGSPAVFASDAMRRLLVIVEKVAATRATVLITGESGCGKEVIARALHHYSPRRSKPWVDVNCGALPENLMESELFGYERGAFSGATSSKPGLFDLAHQGTLFLDEIGDLDQRMQVKLLRVLDGSGYYRLGGVKKVSVDVRLLAATNQDLGRAVEQGRFRSDLYHRLCQIQLEIPPLCERRDDIIPLAKHFLSEQLEQPHVHFSPEALERLRRYPWPGNVRQLRNVVVRAAVFATGPEIADVDLPEQLREHTIVSDLCTLAALPNLERSAITTALEQSGGRQLKAATALGISRRTLQRKIKSYGLAPGRRAVLATRWGAHEE